MGSIRTLLSLLQFVDVAADFSQQFCGDVGHGTRTVNADDEIFVPVVFPTPSKRSDHINVLNKKRRKDHAESKILQPEIVERRGTISLSLFCGRNKIEN